MNRLQKVVALAFSTGWLLAGMASEAADATVSADLVSAYVYHGITYNDGPVFQPSVDVSKNGFGFNTWANMDIGDYNGALNSGDFSEVDLTAYWATRSLGVDWCVSYAEYLFPNVSDGDGALAGTREIILAGDRPLPMGFVAGFKVQYDIDEYDDFYAKASLSHIYTVGGGFDLNTSVSGGYAGEGVAIGGESGFNDYGLKLGLVYQASKELKVNGFIAYAGSIDEDVLPDQDVHVYGGLGLSCAL